MRFIHTRETTPVAHYTCTPLLTSADTAGEVAVPWLQDAATDWYVARPLSRSCRQLCVGTVPREAMLRWLPTSLTTQVALHGTGRHRPRCICCDSLIFSFLSATAGDKNPGGGLAEDHTSLSMRLSHTTLGSAMPRRSRVWRQGLGVWSRSPECGSKAVSCGI